jgi:iron complex outermembrane receptor protein
VPKNNLSVALNQQLRLLGEVVSVGGHYQYVSSRLGDAADLSFRLPSYQLVGLFAQWQVNDKTQLSANIDNLFDESYIASSYNELWAYPGAPTQFKLGLTYDF